MAAKNGNRNRHLKKAAFLKAYGECGNVRQAAKAANIDRTTHYLWLHKDEEYATAFEDAQEDAADTLEAEAWARATGGDKPSDTLLIFLLKGMRPEKYRERIDQTVQVDATQTAEVVEDTDWYGTRARLSAEAFDAPTGNLAAPGALQGKPKRAPGGQNGNGASGNGKGQRT